MVSVPAARWIACDTTFITAASPMIGWRAAALRQFFLEQRVLSDQPPLRERTVDQEKKMIGVDGLGEEIQGAGLHRLDGFLNASEGGHDDHRELGIELLGGLEHAQAVAYRKPQIRQHEGGRRLPQALDSFGLVARFDRRDGCATRVRAASWHAASLCLRPGESERE